LLIVLLDIEFKAIDKDRAENQEQQTRFFTAQKEGFSNIAEGLKETIKNLNQTLLQTAPRALFGKPHIDMGDVQIASGSQFHYNLTMTNVGNDVAQHVDIFSQMYFGKPDDAASQRILTIRFDKDWRSHRTIMPSDVPPGSSALKTFYSPQFTEEDVQAVQAATLTLFVFSRTKYSDGTGTWYSDYCSDVQVPIQSAGLLGHPCPIPTSFRYKSKRP